ncbi:MAG TPA: hypothetical protein VIC54_13085 [Terriglobales bacterium]
MAGAAQAPSPAALPTAPFESGGRVLYLLAAGCQYTGGMSYAIVNPALYFATAHAALARVRDIGVGGCGIEYVRDDEAGTLYMVSGTLDQITAITTIHENAPTRRDGDAPLAWSTGSYASRPFADIFVTAVTAAAGPRGHSWLLFLRHENSNDFRPTSPWRLLRYRGDAIAGQPRLQEGAWSDYSAIRYRGALPPGMYISAYQQEEASQGAPPLMANTQTNGIVLPSVLFRSDSRAVAAPLAPALRAGPLPGSTLILAASSQYFVCTAPLHSVVNGRIAADQGHVTAFVLDRRKRTWRTLTLPISSNAPTALLFGNWLVLPVAVPGPQSPIPTGHFLLMNLDRRRTLAIEAGSPDSEILAISGDEVVYRVQDRILMAAIEGGKLGPPRVLAQGGGAANVHWAFWSSAQPN